MAHAQAPEHRAGEVPPATPNKLWTRDFIVIALINLMTFIGFNMTTTGMPVYVSSLGASDLIAGLVTTLTTGATLLIRPFSGMVLDRFGRKGILVAGIGAMVLTTAAYGVFPILGVILGIRLCHGIAWGLTSTATSTIAADLIPRKRFAEGMGYFALASAIAIAIAPALAIGVLQSVGIKPMIAIAAAATVVAFLLSFFQHTVKIAPDEDGGELRFAAFFEKRAALPAAVVFLINCAFGAIMTFIALHGQARGVDQIWLYFTVYAVVTLVSRPLTGKIIDKSGFFLPGIFSVIGVVVTLILISFSHTISMFCLAGVFAGVGFGTGMGTLQTMAVSAVAPGRRGVATSTYFFGFDGGIGAGALIAGALAGILGYGTMFLAMASFPLAGLILFLLAGKKRIAAYGAR